MSSPIRFEILARDAVSSARVGRVTTPHGSFDTPAFMPVGTRAAVKGLAPDQIRATGTQIVLNNAYHLMLRPGSELIRRRGGCHAFMRWDGPILTDSGGYQVFSMSDINRIDDDGVTFRSIIDGALIHLSPERSIEVQNDLGADIIMAFDDCPSSVDPRSAEQKRNLNAPGNANAGENDAVTSRQQQRPRGSPANHRKRLAIAAERTTRWLERCVNAHARPGEQALFGIVQGGTFADLRQRSAEEICSFDLSGYAIGGVAVGEGPQDIRRIVDLTAPLLPPDRPRYLMGVGYERDIVSAVRAGVDMFDCVLPTRNGRNGNAFTRGGSIQLRNARFSEDDDPVDPACGCPTCAAGFSRAYLRHLFMSGEMLGPILLSVHNISHFQSLMLDIRRAVRENDWSVLPARWPVLAVEDRVEPGKSGGIPQEYESI